MNAEAAAAGGAVRGAASAGAPGTSGAGGGDKVFKLVWDEQDAEGDTGGLSSNSATASAASGGLDADAAQAFLLLDKVRLFLMGCPSATAEWLLVLL